MTTTTIPAKGDPWTFEHTEGYKLLQERPFACRPLCQCGTCSGRTFYTIETITRVIHWADNSIEVVGDGGSHAELVAPHGDLC